MIAKKRIVSILTAVLTAFAMIPGTTGIAYASGGSCAPLVITEGFNADGVLEKDGEADYMDNDRSRNCLYADPDREGSLPLNGVIQTTGGGYFKLGKYDQKNFLRLEVGQRGTLSFDEKSRKASKNLSFLVTGCDSGGTVTATVHFAGTDETAAGSFEVPDWGNSGDYTAYRCGRYSQQHSEYEETGNYRLFERRIDIPEGLKDHAVTSIDLDLTSEIDNSCKACVFAVTATPTVDTRSVIYDANGGTLIFSSGVDSAPAGGKVTLPEAERGEDGLEGWYDGETKVGTSNESYTVSDNVVLKAKWKEIFIRVILYGEGSTPQKIYQNDDGTYDHPQMDNYTFKGFSETENGELIDESTLVAGNTYYAVWEEDPFVTISFGSLGKQTIHLNKDLFITGHEDLPKIGTKLSEDMIVGGYYSDAEFTNPVDVHSPIPEELFGKTIYVKLGDTPPSGDDPTPEPGSDPNQMGTDGTPVGPGASAAAAENAITSATNEEGPKGTKYAKLRLRSTKQTNSSVKLTWTTSKNASEYVIYGSACGKNSKMKKLTSTTAAAKSIATISGKKLAKGKYYKFIIVALDKDNNVVSTSKVAHVATKGGKVGNHKKVTVKKTVIKKAKKLKKGKSLKLKAKAVKASKRTVKKHRAVSYESSNAAIATVSSKGVVKGKSKGTCYVYAYAQNGVAKKIKIVVK